MKKIISLIIAVLMMATLLCAAIPASAAETAECNLYYDGVDFGGLSFTEACDIAQSGAFGNGNYKIKLNQNVELKKTFNPTHAGNIEFDGLLADGTKAIINSTVTKNNWRLQGGAKYVFRNVHLKGQAIEGCLIQLNHGQFGGDLDLIDCVVDSQDLYFTINAMATSGLKQTVNIIRTTINQTAYVNSDATAIRTRCIVGTCNPGGQFMHLELNVVDSTLISEAGIVWVNRGSTADINLKNSRLELKAHSGGLTSHSETNYLPTMAAIVIDKIEDLKGVADMPTGATINSENSMIVAASGYETIVIAEGETNVVNNYVPAEVNPEVTTPEEDLELDLGLPEVTTTEPEETTTEPEVTTTEPEEITTEPEEITTEPEEITTEPEEITTEPIEETTPGADVTTEAPKGDVTTEAPKADDTTAAEEVAGGCAGCGGLLGDGAVTTVAAIVIAMAAAVAIIVKKK